MSSKTPIFAKAWYFHAIYWAVNFLIMTLVLMLHPYKEKINDYKDLILPIGGIVLGIALLITSKLKKIRMGYLTSFGPSKKSGKDLALYIIGYIFIIISISYLLIKY